MSGTFNIVNSVGWTLDNTVTPNIYWKIFASTANNIKYIESGASKWMSLNTVGGSATSSDRNTAWYVVAFDAASHTYTASPETVGALNHHIQCAFVYPRWCWDNIIDTDKGEQCDDGNKTNGDGCSNTCTTETSSLSCNNLGISPATLSKDGGTITATCSATNATQYKFILKQSGSTISTVAYQTSATTTFSLPANTDTSNKTYTVDCYVKNTTQTDITATSCNKSITVPGTTIEQSVCNNLTLSHTTVQTNTPVTYICSATNATSYIIKRWSSVIGYLPEGTMSFPEAGTYSIGCFINGLTDTPVSCAKSITVTTPPVMTNPSVFIDKDDSTPGTPDTDGNDIQRVQNNGTATFTILVRNNGNEALKTVAIDDTLSPDCARTTTQTASLYAGGATANFDVGESFTYTCTKNNVTNSTFPNNRNTAVVRGVGVSSGTNVTDSDITEIFLKQEWTPRISIEKDDADDFNDEQEIDEDETAKFSIEVTNTGDESLENVIIEDDLASDCERDESETRALIREIGNRDALFDPGEKFDYTCREKSVTVDTFPDEKNTACTEANGVDSDKDVDDCDDTEIIVNENNSNPICSGIESSEGTFWWAPFRTTISCEAEDYDSCEIQISKDGHIINTYNSCTRNITFSDTGDYDVACIVNDKESSDCEMEISVESMTDIPTGTKIIMLGLLSILWASIGTYFYRQRREM